MAMKLFSRHLSKSNEDTTVIGIKVSGGNSPAINHLFFADDCLIFTQASLSSVNNLLQLLQEFISQFGQVINSDKSSVYFSKSVNPEVASAFTHFLGIKTMNAKGMYLGSPLIFGYYKQESFKDIK
ncbi:uncharacterized protein LOC113326302 [Papaver somniferum]|uniref:uncharacterized protein LOC113326302 n=1 Tax=Papaver somniferum TaxID=3469 RepID=UPI000E6F50C7|nr:uncharacterized protein LOC113326302 [Papaver somniferum]